MLAAPNLPEHALTSANIAAMDIIRLAFPHRH
jgi:hypothetical protein